MTPSIDPAGRPVSPGALTNSQLFLLHQLYGWGGLGLFVCLGALLEVLLAYRAAWLVGADHTVTRTMLRLAHAHGTLLAVLQFCFALSVRSVAPASDAVAPRGLRMASGAMTASQLLIPGGFLAGALAAEGSDPGLGVLLVPAGAGFLLLGIALTFVELFRFRPGRRTRSQEGAE
jgi:hypothetical protein